MSAAHFFVIFFQTGKCVENLKHIFRSDSRSLTRQGKIRSCDVRELSTGSSGVIVHGAIVRGLRSSVRRMVSVGERVDK